MSSITTVRTITLLTGISAAGKSTVAQALAERLEPSVHVRGDVFRRMVINGREEMTAEPSAEALQQLDLRYRLAVNAALGYYTAGFHVVYQDVILGASLSQVVAMFGKTPVNVVVLCPRAEVVAVREELRNKNGYAGFTVDELDHVLRRETPRIGTWIDSSDLTIDQTVDRILARQASAI